MSQARLVAARFDVEIAKLRAAFLEKPRPADEKQRVKELLAHMVEVDQRALALAHELTGDTRGMTKAQEDALRRELGKALRAVAIAHAKELQVILDKHGWPGIKSFGRRADSHAWLIVQHADAMPGFQTEVLELLDRLRGQGETDPSNYAYLWDRVAIHYGRPQRYGTQGRLVRPGRWEPEQPIEDQARLDERRKSVGLEPLAEYQKRFGGSGF